MQKSLYLSFI